MYVEWLACWVCCIATVGARASEVLAPVSTITAMLYCHDGAMLCLIALSLWYNVVGFATTLATFLAKTIHTSPVLICFLVGAKVVPGAGQKPVLLTGFCSDNY